MASIIISTRFEFDFPVLGLGSVTNLYDIERLRDNSLTINRCEMRCGFETILSLT